MTSQCGFLCVATEEDVIHGHAALCNLISWQSKKCPRVVRSSSTAEVRRAAQEQDEMEYVRLLCYELEHGTVHVRLQDSKSQLRLEPSSSTQKKVFDAVSTAKIAELTMVDKSSSVEALSMRESLTRSRTRDTLRCQRERRTHEV